MIRLQYPFAMQKLLIALTMMVLTVGLVNGQQTSNKEKGNLLPNDPIVLEVGKQLQEKYKEAEVASEAFYVDGQPFVYFKGEQPGTRSITTYNSPVLPPPSDKWVMIRYSRVEGVASYGYLFVWSASVTWGKGSETVRRSLNDPCLYVVTDVIGVMGQYGSNYNLIASTWGEVITQCVQEGAPFLDYLVFDNSYDLLLVAAYSSWGAEYEDQFYRLMRKIAATRPTT